MLKNEKILITTFKEFYRKLLFNEFVTDKTGSKTIALVDYSIRKLNPLQPFLEFNGRKSPIDYIKKESKWYNSCSLNIKGYVDDIKIWNLVCDKDGYINSNYGWCIYSKENYKQYNHVLEELLNNKDSRRATMIYTRPSMWVDYNQDGMSDFMCTWGTHHIIENNKLIYIINQRSSDFIFGFFNDFAHHCEVYEKLYNDLKVKYKDLEIGWISFNFGSLHIYERHFEMLKKIVEA